MTLPFIVYTPARTGSTTLMQVLNCHGGVKCAFEPFNPGNVGQYASRCQVIQQTHGLEVAVQSLWAICNGFKHVWHPDGWPFVDDPEMNHRLLLLPGVTVILLSRRNALRRAMSVQISDQMQMWVPRNPEEWQRVREHHYGPLDIVKLREEIAGERAEHKRVREVLVKSGQTWREIYYEDFFGPRMTVEERMEAAQGLLEYLGAGRVRDAEKLSAMRRLFDPKATGFENAAAYGKIPNIAEVERELGCAETGFVFVG